MFDLKHPHPLGMFFRAVTQRRLHGIQISGPEICKKRPPRRVGEGENRRVRIQLEKLGAADCFEPQNALNE